MAVAKSILCHPEGAFSSDRRVSCTVLEMLRCAQHDKILFCHATLLQPYGGNYDFWDAGFIACRNIPSSAYSKNRPSLADRIPPGLRAYHCG